jgi:hypothetical protein
MDRGAAERWIRRHVMPTGPIEPAKEQPWSTVLRVPTEGGAVWFKRCKSIWAFEARLTAALAARWPDRVPGVLAHDEERAWLLLRDAGTQVERLPDAHEVWLHAIRLYAELQRGEAAYTDDHLAHGVPDQRTATLPAQYAEMLERDELPWRGDQRERLRRFERRFGDLCTDLGDAATIQHDDLHIYNVYDGPRILDWGDSCIAHPFFSLVVTFMFVDAAGHDEIRAAYLEAYGADRDAFDLALRVGRIAHVFKWIRFREVLPDAMLREYDDGFVEWLAQAAAQTDE